LYRRARTSFHQIVSQKRGGAVCILANLRPKCQAEDVHVATLQPAQRASQTIDLPPRLTVVDHASQGCKLLPNAVPLCAVDQEVRINWRAMTSDADPGLKQGGLTIGVGCAQKRPDVEAKCLSERGDFVGQRNVHIAVDHAGKLYKFGCFEASDINHRSTQPSSIKLHACRGACGIHAAYDLRCVGESRKDEARLHSLGTKHDRELAPGFETAALENRYQGSPAPSYWQRRLVRHEHALP